MNKGLFDINIGSDGQLHLLLKLFDTISDILIFKNIDGKYLGCNSACAEFFGRPKEDLIGKTNFDLFPKYMAEKFRERENKVIETKQSDCNEVWLSDHDGRPMLFEVHKTPLFNDNGDLIGILCVSHDITQRKQFEDEILSRDSLLIAISEAINELMINPDINEAITNAFEMIGNIINVDRITLFENRFDKENNKIFSNYKCAWVSAPVYSQANDPTALNLPIDDFYDIIGPLNRKKIMAGNTEDMEPEFKKLLELHGVSSFMLFPIHIEENFWGFIGFDDCKSKRAWNEAEKAILMTFAASISRGLERNQQREQEKNKERKIKTILNNIQDGIITLSENCIIQSCNPAIVNMFGYSLAEIIGSSLDLLIQGFCTCTNKNCISESCHLRENFIYEGNINGKRKDGTEFPIEIDSRKIDFDNKAIVLLVIRDITQQKEVERLKNEFISTVSHEIRTPLTSIRGSLGLISSNTLGVLPEKAGNLINIANNNTIRLINLINDILDLEKMKAGKMEFKFAKYEILPIVTETIEFIGEYAKLYNVKYEITKSLNNIFVNVDKDRFIQVLTNLLSNAAKFSPENEPVKISMSKENNFILVAVTNKGQGISEQDYSKIFGSFSQVDSSDNRKRSGTGLGLCISKSLIEKMGGSMGFTSKLNEETTFYFKLPEAT